MASRVSLLICSDLHYACAAEKKRVNYEINAIDNALQRTFVRLYRRYFWLRDPFAHNHLLEQVLNFRFEPDLAIANGDYSCDSAFVGLADRAALESARECLDKLRTRFGERLLPVFGDHELGKVSLCGGKGGLRLESLRLAQEELKLEPIWTKRIGNYLLIAVTSSLVAMPVYERETLPEERQQWWEIARQHLHAIRAVFAGIKPEDKVLLFCHDPTALPYLWQLAAVRSRISQVERTIIGHLHSDFILRQSRVLSGLPQIRFCGQAIRRISSALTKAKQWRPFNLLLCPSPAGIELTRKGGFYTGTIDPSGRAPAEFQLHVIRR